MSGRVAVIGAGAWGTALACAMARGGPVTLWGRDAGVVRQINTERTNRFYLGTAELPGAIAATTDLAEALDDARFVLMAVPAQTMRAMLAMMVPHLHADMVLVSCAKGIERDSGDLMSDVIAHTAPANRRAVLSGPSFAADVARGLPTAVTLAMADEKAALAAAEALSRPGFRLYAGGDPNGVEYGGALKNVLAIAAGIADGLGFGANTRAALITRGLAELIRLGTALGGRHETFMGLAGLGDLVLTCTDDQSRNRRLGLALARNDTAGHAMAAIGQEVEGIVTARAVHKIAAERGVEMPISEQVHAVLYSGRTPEVATRQLLERAGKAELD